MGDNLKLSSPWVTQANLMKAFFDPDPEVEIIYSSDDSDDNELDVYVSNPFKADALSQVLPESYDFGNVKLKVNVIPANDDVSYAQLLRTALQGNPMLVDAGDVDEAGLSYQYLLFSPFVLQYWNDELLHPFGIRTVLPEQAAHEIFTDAPEGEIVSMVTCPVVDD